MYLFISGEYSRFFLQLATIQFIFPMRSNINELSLFEDKNLDDFKHREIAGLLSDSLGLKNGINFKSITVSYLKYSIDNSIV